MFDVIIIFFHHTKYLIMMEKARGHSAHLTWTRQGTTRTSEVSTLSRTKQVTSK